MTEPTAQPLLTQSDREEVDANVRSIVSELLDAHARTQRVERSFLDDIEKYEKVARTVCNTVALPEWIRGEWIKGDGPKTWRGRPPAEQEKIALSVIMAGAELGIPPMVSLRHIFLVEGKVGLSAEMMLTKIIQAGVKFRWVEKTNEKATIWLHRMPHDPESFTFTIEDAKKAELTGKFNWKAYPAAMLRARAISAGARAYCPDITNGCYSREEMEDLAEELPARAPTSLNQIAATASAAPVDDGPVAIKLIAKIKQVTTQDEYRLVVQDANYLAHELDDAEKQAVKLALEAAVVRLKGAAAPNG